MHNGKHTKVHSVSNSMEVQEQVYRFQNEGYSSDHIFVLTHERIAETQAA